MVAMETADIDCQIHHCITMISFRLHAGIVQPGNRLWLPDWAVIRDWPLFQHSE